MFQQILARLFELAMRVRFAEGAPHCGPKFCGIFL